MKRTHVALVAIVVIALLGSMPAWVRAKDKPPASPPAATDPTVTTPASPAPKLSYAEQVALQALANEEHADQQALENVYQKERLLVQDITRNHPGYTFNPASGQLTKSDVPRPAAPPAKK